MTKSSATYSRPANRLQFVDSSPLLGDADALRARADEDGCLFFRRLLPSGALRAVRADVLNVLDRHGWRRPGQGRLGGLLDLSAVNAVSVESMRTDIGVSAAIYANVQKLESLHRLPHHPRLIALYRTLFGREVLLHPRHIVRMVTPHPCMVPTPPHQDFPLVQGTANTWTSWFPLGACPRSLGGLAVLRGSHRAGYIPIRSAKGAGGLAVRLCPRETAWMEGDFGAGDVLTFPSHTVHRALRCVFKDRIRLSLDVRFQPADEPIEERALLPHCSLTWEEIYANWRRDDLKYYWRAQSPRLSPWNDCYVQPSRRIC